MIIQEPPKLDRTLSAELKELDRREAELLAQLSELKRDRSNRNPGAPSIGRVEEQLIQIHGRKSGLRTHRSQPG
jgi:hypothetical protein